MINDVFVIIGLGIVAIVSVIFALSYKNKANKLMNAIKEENSKNEALEKEIVACKISVEEMAEMCKNSDNKISFLYNNISELNQQVSTEEKKYDTLLSEYNKKIRANDILNNSIDEFKSQIANLNDNLESSNKEIQNLNEQLEIKKAELIRLEEENKSIKAMLSEPTPFMGLDKAYEVLQKKEHEIANGQLECLRPLAEEMLQTESPDNVNLNSDEVSIINNHAFINHYEKKLPYYEKEYFTLILAEATTKFIRDNKLRLRIEILPTNSSNYKIVEYSFEDEKMSEWSFVTFTRNSLSNENFELYNSYYEECCGCYNLKLQRKNWCNDVKILKENDKEAIMIWQSDILLKEDISDIKISVIQC